MAVKDAASVAAFFKTYFPDKKRITLPLAETFGRKGPEGRAV
jgi:hypothetical protein